MTPTSSGTGLLRPGTERRTADSARSARCPDRAALRAELIEAGRQAWRWTQHEIELRARLDELEAGAAEARDG